MTRYQHGPTYYHDGARIRVPARSFGADEGAEVAHHLPRVGYGLWVILIPTKDGELSPLLPDAMPSSISVTYCNYNRIFFTRYPRLQLARVDGTHSVLRIPLGGHLLQQVSGNTTITLAYKCLPFSERFFAVGIEYAELSL